MPEINRVEAIREKLRTFDEVVAGAIVSAESLARLRNEGDALLLEIGRLSESTEKSLSEIEDKMPLLRQLDGDWNELRRQIESSLSESSALRARLSDQVSLAIQGLAAEVARAEARLNESNEKARTRQEDTLRSFEVAGRSSAERAESAKQTCESTAASLNELLAKVQNDLQGRVEREAQELENRLARLIREKLEAFGSAAESKLQQQEDEIDGKITNFLVKQNALIENLTQHVESYERVGQVIGSDIREIKEGLHSARTQTTALSRAVAETNTSLRKLQSEVVVGRQEFAALLNKLAQLPFVGKNFKS